MKDYKIITKFKRKKDIYVFKCNFCGREFSNEYNVRRHQKQKHQADLIKEKN